MENRVVTKEMFVKQTKLHHHKDDLELVLVIKGEIHLHKVERMVTLKENEFALVNRDVPHYINSDEGATVLLTHIRLSKFIDIFDKMEYVEFITLEELNCIDNPLKKRLDSIVIDFIINYGIYPNTPKYINVILLVLFLVIWFYFSWSLKKGKEKYFKTMIL